MMISMSFDLLSWIWRIWLNPNIQQLLSIDHLIIRQSQLCPDPNLAALVSQHNIHVSPALIVISKYYGWSTIINGHKWSCPAWITIIHSQTIGQYGWCLSKIHQPWLQVRFYCHSVATITNHSRGNLWRSRVALGGLQGQALCSTMGWCNVTWESIPASRAKWTKHRAKTKDSWTMVHS